MSNVQTDYHPDLCNLQHCINRDKCWRLDCKPIVVTLIFSLTPILLFLLLYISIHLRKE